MQTFIESRKLAEEKMLDKCHHLKDNTLEPTTATNASKEALVAVVGHAPSTEQVQEMLSQSV